MQMMHLQTTACKTDKYHTCAFLNLIYFVHYSVYAKYSDRLALASIVDPDTCSTLEGSHKTVAQSYYGNGFTVMKYASITEAQRSWGGLFNDNLRDNCIQNCHLEGKTLVLKLKILFYLNESVEP